MQHSRRMSRIDTHTHTHTHIYTHTHTPQSVGVQPVFVLGLIIAFSSRHSSQTDEPNQSVRSWRIPTHVKGAGVRTVASSPPLQKQNPARERETPPLRKKTGALPLPLQSQFPVERGPFRADKREGGVVEDPGCSGVDRARPQGVVGWLGLEEEGWFLSAGRGL